MVGPEDQAEGFGCRSQRHEVRDLKPEDRRVRTDTIGDSSGPPPEEWNGYLLAPMKRSQATELDEFIGYAADAVRSIIAEGVVKAMTRFNRRAPGLNKEEA